MQIVGTVLCPHAVFETLLTANDFDDIELTPILLPSSRSTLLSSTIQFSIRKESSNSTSHIFDMANFCDIFIDPEELINGYSASEIFTSKDCQGITFDDLIVLPGAIDFGVHEVELTTRVTRNFKLNSPFCSTPMDTVTEHEMALGMALNGGIGFIHSNCSIEEQVAMVLRVKHYENGFIMEPAVMSPNNTISDLDRLRDDRKISGVPLTVDGKMGSKLVGLVSNRDTDFILDRTMKLADIMTPLDQLVTGPYPISIAEANEILKVSTLTFYLVRFSDFIFEYSTIFLS